MAGRKLRDLPRVDYTGMDYTGPPSQAPKRDWSHKKPNPRPGANSGENKTGIDDVWVSAAGGQAYLQSRDDRDFGRVNVPVDLTKMAQLQKLRAALHGLGGKRVRKADAKFKRTLKLKDKPTRESDLICKDLLIEHVQNTMSRPERTIEVIQAMARRNAAHYPAAPTQATVEQTARAARAAKREETAELQQLG